jgi:hypothetical protein
LLEWLTSAAWLRVNGNPVRRREVDDNAVIAQGPASDVVAAAFDRDKKVVRTRKLHGANDVGHFRTANGSTEDIEVVELDERTTDANTSLLAAVPDLLAALEGLLAAAGHLSPLGGSNGITRLNMAAGSTWQSPNWVFFPPNASTAGCPTKDSSPARSRLGRPIATRNTPRPIGVSPRRALVSNSSISNLVLNDSGD